MNAQSHILTKTGKRDLNAFRKKTQVPAHKKLFQWLNQFQVECNCIGLQRKRPGNKSKL